MSEVLSSAGASVPGVEVTGFLVGVFLQDTMENAIADANKRHKSFAHFLAIIFPLSFSQKHICIISLNRRTESVSTQALIKRFLQ